MTTIIKRSLSISTAGRAPARFIRPGFTLIEVMVALVVFSVLIGMGSRFVASGVRQPFVADRVEPWLQFLEESRISVQNLSPQSQLLSSGIHKDPFPGIPKPVVLSSWQLEWKSTGLEGYRTAYFTALTQHHKTIEWYVFQKTQ